MDPAYAARYAEVVRDHWWFQGRARIVAAELDRALPPGPAAARPRLLSVGCGPRPGLDWLERRGRVIGLDVEPWPGPGAPLVLGTAERLPFPDGAFDAAVALDVLEHLDDDAAGARELARVVRPGGPIIITVPAHPWLWSHHDAVNQHRRRYTRATLRAVLEAAGLRPRVTHFNALLLAPVAAARLAGRALEALGRRPSEGGDLSPRPALGGLLGAVLGVERHLLARGATFPAGVSLLAVARAGRTS
jgi:SAM-dependent methyltransferase